MAWKFDVVVIVSNYKAKIDISTDSFYKELQDISLNRNDLSTELIEIMTKNNIDTALGNYNLKDGMYEIEFLDQ